MFSIAAMKRVFRKETNKKVGKDAAEKLRDELEAKATNIAQDAVVNAENQGRKTVKSRDLPV